MKNTIKKRNRIGSKRISTKKYRNIPFTKCNQKTQKCRDYCMDVDGAKCGNKVDIIYYPCHSGENQQFAYKRKSKQLIAKHSKKCVQVNLKTGRMFQSECNSKKKTQKWKKHGNTWRAVSNKKCMDLAECTFNSDQGFCDFQRGSMITTSCKH